ncbi:Brp/Blh family beta-carotene 15,15'-dioxygenase [Candidatus Pelagibacter communis]|uniref:Brp/Blh family beta-carotene 15,15'-dioxygenase n=1 Tax=Pelagibacter ubique TaxID=198252 RepID=UPI00094C7613|nr:Brp/Blh family beta-carotene 15,15'-dioxygenase [Candidatus Pelagibacter ubique]
MNNQIKRINTNHSFIFFLFCNIFSLITFNGNYFFFSPLICLFLILSIGVSHGSLDNFKGKKLFQVLGIKNFYMFYFSYIAISLTIIVLWILIPTISLVIFLIIASYHFGKEDTQFLINENSYFNQFLFFLKGCLVILAPLYFHFDETIFLFKLLLIENEIFYEFLNLVEKNKIVLFGIILSTLSSILLFIKNFEFKKMTIFLDYFSILIVNYYFSPLAAFTIYFCFLHSIRHSISLISELDQNNLKNGLKLFIKKALPLTILTATFCLIGLYILNNSYNFDNSVVKVIFIGLASLTFPHILLEYLIEKNEK